MADNTMRGRMATLEAEMAGVRGDVTEMKEDVKTLLAAWNQYKGKSKLVTWLLATLAGSSMLGWFVEHFGGKG